MMKATTFWGSLLAFGLVLTPSLALADVTIDAHSNHTESSVIWVDEVSETEDIVLTSALLDATEPTEVSALSVIISGASQNPELFLTNVRMEVGDRTISSSTFATSDNDLIVTFVPDPVLVLSGSSELNFVVDFLPYPEDAPQAFSVLFSADAGGVVADTTVTGSVGSEHIFFSRGTFAEIVSTDAEVNTSGAGEYGQFEFRFDLTALGDDILIPTDASDFAVAINDIFANRPTVLSSTADQFEANYVIRDGDTEQFTLQVMGTPSETGLLVAQLSAFGYSLASSPEVVHLYFPTPASDFTTSAITVGEAETETRARLAGLTAPSWKITHEPLYWNATFYSETTTTVPFMSYVEVVNDATGEIVSRHGEIVPAGTTGAYHVSDYFVTDTPGTFSVNVGEFTPDWSELLNWHHRRLIIEAEESNPVFTFDGVTIEGSHTVGEEQLVWVDISNSNNTVPALVLTHIYDESGELAASYVTESTTISQHRRLLHYFTPETDGTYYVSVGIFTRDWSHMYAWFHHGDRFGFSEEAAFTPTVGTTEIAAFNSDLLSINANLASNTNGEVNVLFIVTREDVNVSHRVVERVTLSPSSTRISTTVPRPTQPGFYYVDVALFSQDWSTMYEYRWHADYVQL